MGDLAGRDRQLDVLARHVLEERGEVDLLLVAAAERERALLADDRHHRLVVELGVVEAVEEVDGARPGGGEADADVASELGVAARHEGGELLVGGLDELDAVNLVEAAEDAVDPVAGIAVDALDAVVGKALEDVLADGAAHASFLLGIKPL